MSESFTNDNRAMGKNIAVLTIACLMLCLSFNYTFPLQANTKIKTTSLANHSQSSERVKQEHSEGIVERTKKMAVNLENALRKFIDSTPNKAKGKCSHSKHGVVDSDLSNYEQLVIMKKYPFLDLQELDFNLRPPSKNTRQNLNSAQVLAQDPSFCESVEEGLNVEITNRGLSGFALPTKNTKSENTAEDKKDKNNSQNVIETESNTSSSTVQAPDDLRLIESLEEDIEKFEQHLT